MKQLFVLLSAFLLTTAVNAQHETLFGKARVVGAFGGPIFEFGLNNNQNTAMGGGGGIIINSFFIGGYGVASLDFDQLFDEGEVDVLDIGHGGIWLGATYQPYRLLHVYGSAKIGWGVINVDLHDNVPYREIDKIFVASPEIGVELNIARWFRVGGTIGYRFVNGTDESLGYKDKDFSGAYIGLTTRFGWFGRRRS